MKKITTPVPQILFSDIFLDDKTENLDMPICNLPVLI